MANRKGGSRGSTRSTHGNGGKAKAIIIAVAIIIIAAVFALSIGSKGFTQKHPKDWFNNWGQATSKPVGPDDPDNDTNNNSTATVVGEGGAVITGYASNGGAVFRSARILKTEYEDYSIAPQSDGAYSINVINEIEGAIDTYSWESSNAEKVSISSVSEDTKYKVMLLFR